jgi:PST family polysaccharide transporter
MAVTMAQSVAFLIGGLGAQHDATLTRNLQFKRKAGISIAGSILTLIVSVSMAWKGYSYWSLVVGSLSGALLSTVLLYVLCPIKVVGFSRQAGTKEMMKFGADVTANSMVFFFCRNADNILIGRVWGPAELGMYSRAYSLLMLPINAIKGPLESVSFASLCKLQDRPNEFRDYYRTLVRFTALISMPFSGMLLACSGPVIAIALGPQWQEVTAIFSVLAIVAMMQPTASLWGIMLLGLGRSKRLLVANIINAAIYITGMAIGVYWKGIGVAVGYAASYYIALPIILTFAFRNSPVSVLDFGRAIVRPIVASIGASLAVIALGRGIHIESPVIDLVVRAGSFCLSFCALFFVMPGAKSDLALVRRSAAILRPKAKA